MPKTGPRQRERNGGVIAQGESKHGGTNSCLRARQWRGGRVVVNGADISKALSASPTPTCRGQSGLEEVDLGIGHSARQLELN